MSNSRPADYTTDLVRVRTAGRAHVTAIAHYKTVNRRETATANRHGQATLRYYLNGATPGYQVRVTVQVSLGRRTGHCSTSFTPHRRARTAAWCTARASYNFRYRDYDIYVHSNQPNRTVTATASNGASQSWHTNSKGYADVYLYANHGDTVNVRAGAASCSTTA